MIEHLATLLAGNRRFVSGKPQAIPATASRVELADGQAPFAAVLGCSDSRVPVESVFDRNPGDIFVVRVAGNVVDEAGLGSIEYAVTVLKSSLILVLGHSNCGAVTAALQYVKTGLAAPGHIQGIIDAIVPAAQTLGAGSDEWLEKAVAENVRLTMQALHARSKILENAVSSGTLTITGGVYDLRTGKVSLIDDIARG